jgi:hypothetical protein
MWRQGAAATVTAAELSPYRYLVSVGGTLDETAGASLRDVIMPLVGADGTTILIDLADAALEGYDPVPTLAGAAAMAAAGGGSLTVVTDDRRLRALLETDLHITVEGRLEEHLL